MPTLPGCLAGREGGAVGLAGVGRAAVARWRERLPGFPAPVGGTETSPVFARRAVVVWLLEHDKLTIPTTLPAATVRATGAGSPHSDESDSA